MPGNFKLEDKQLTVSTALPNGAATVNGTAMDLGQNHLTGDFVAPAEIVINAPAVAVGQLADTTTLTYDVQHSSDNSSFSVLMDNVIVQTGAGGAGAAAAEFRGRLPSTVKRYVRLSVVKTGAADASGATATTKLVF